jgi:hypothetical protein
MITKSIKATVKRSLLDRDSEKSELFLKTHEPFAPRLKNSDTEFLTAGAGSLYHQSLAHMNSLRKKLTIAACHAVVPPLAGRRRSCPG